MSFPTLNQKNLITAILEWERDSISSDSYLRNLRPETLMAEQK